jgi:hypothetical protein
VAEYKGLSAIVRLIGYQLQSVNNVRRRPGNLFSTVAAFAKFEDPQRPCVAPMLSGLTGCGAGQFRGSPAIASP